VVLVWRSISSRWVRRTSSASSLAWTWRSTMSSMRRSSQFAGRECQAQGGVLLAEAERGGVAAAARAGDQQVRLILRAQPAGYLRVGAKIGGHLGVRLRAV